MVSVDSDPDPDPDTDTGRTKRSPKKEKLKKYGIMFQELSGGLEASAGA
jgi:hypothetical protein